eukprot:11575354-Alexandrium_andersonii.AAC.1
MAQQQWCNARLTPLHPAYNCFRQVQACLSSCRRCLPLSVVLKAVFGAFRRNPKAPKTARRRPQAAKHA